MFDGFLQMSRSGTEVLGLTNRLQGRQSLNQCLVDFELRILKLQHPVYYAPKQLHESDAYYLP